MPATARLMFFGLSEVQENMVMRAEMPGMRVNQWHETMMLDELSASADFASADFASMERSQQLPDILSIL